MTLFLLAGSCLMQPQMVPEQQRAAHAHACAADAGDDIGFVSADDPVVSTAWRPGVLANKKAYWYRDNAETGEPEISLTDPLEGWKVGMLESGREYFWRSTGEGGDDTQVLLASFSSDEDADASSEVQSSEGWRVGTTASGREYTWRHDPDAPEYEEPEVRLWTTSVDDAGDVFWWDEGGSGDVSLEDPFERARKHGR